MNFITVLIIANAIPMIIILFIKTVLKDAEDDELATVYALFAFMANVIAIIIILIDA